MSKWSLSALMLVAVFAGSAYAGEGNGERRQFDPEQFRQRMMERTREQLGLSEEEMKAIQPKLEAVQKAQAAARTTAGFGGMGGRGGRGGRGPGGGGEAATGGATAAPAQPSTENLSDTQKKGRELSTLLENKEADPAAVKAKLAEVREAREKARADLKKAQDELKELLTPRQEAQLVMMGTLE